MEAESETSRVTRVSASPCAAANFARPGAFSGVRTAAATR